MLIKKHPVIPIRASRVTYSPYDSSTAKWDVRVGLFLSNLVIKSTAPFFLISIGIRMRNSNKIQNRQIQAAHRVDLGALYQSFNVCVFYRYLFIYF